MMPDYDRERRIFLTTPHTDDSLYLAHLSFLNVDVFNNAVCRRPSYCDDITVAFNDVII